MAKVNGDQFNYQYMTETEALIRRNPQLYAQLKTDKTIKDFKDLDVVKCTYIKGLLRVLGTSLDGKVLVRPIVKFQDYDYEAISPEFLQKVPINQKVLDLLYVEEN